MQNIDPASLGLVLSGGGTRSSYTTGALRALAEVHKVTKPRVLVASSGGAPPGIFSLAGRFEDTYEWPRLFDDPRFISWARLRRGPVMDVNFLIDGILARQAPLLQTEISLETEYFLAATCFPSREPHWFSRHSGEPLFEQLRATATASGVSGPLVTIGGEWFADGHFSISIHDCIAKAFAEGAKRVLVIDNAIYGKASKLTRMVLRYGVRHAHSSVREAVEDYCRQERQPVVPSANVLVCRREKLASRHPLTRSTRLQKATIEQGYEDMATLCLT